MSVSLSWQRAAYRSEVDIGSLRRSGIRLISAATKSIREMQLMLCRVTLGKLNIKFYIYKY